mmetsp:Transcript_21272/g.46656  ORF Transcript_21272/g.46656 Transcript_21272/m.46656 type:complete len:540 (-) Transcript_21272:86-1705(-)|eukprot:CAMPEP_0118941066 /NCGR_PEP_ID=MMETSP1169-20130426/32961_1 /TAXON_ID=36882 /ORGANISM="Pyramimonas obovata, Strain CCMP722" /LENGTH=539 /DNA_ID=CAMNT_0006885723 /DNA_START=149 /DNA_END=1768 /DNA_ORIENTATION=-
MPPAKLSLCAELSHPSFWPGQTLGATINLEAPQAGKQSSTPPQSVRLISLVAQCIGFERKDSLWIRGSTTAPSGDAVGTSAAMSKGERVVFKSAAANLLGACTLPPGGRRWFEVQAALPAMLPPSHRGTAVRWRYSLVITASIDTSLEGSKEGISKEIVVRKPFRVWPTNVGGPHTSPQVSFDSTDLEFDAHIRWREVVPTPLALPNSPQGGNTPAWTLGILSTQGASSSAATPVGRAGVPDGWDHAGSGGTFLTADEVHGNSLGLPPDVAPLPLEDREPLAETSRSPASKFAQAHSVNNSNGEHGNGRAAERSDTATVSDEAVPASKPSKRPDLEPSSTLSSERPAPLLLGGFTTGRTYNMSIGNDPLVRFTPKEASAEYALGGTVAGTLTFHHSVDGEQVWQCAQVLVTLETEEVIPPQHVVTSSAGGDGVIRKVHDEFHEVTFDALETHFLFSIPPDAEVTFSTSLVQLRWLLRFEFVALSVQPGHKAPITTSTDVNRMSWRMPVVVRPSKVVRNRAPVSTTSQIALEPLPPPPAI